MKVFTAVSPVIHNLGEHSLINQIKIPKTDRIVEQKKRLPFFLLGDDSFVMSDDLMKPYSRAELSLDEKCSAIDLSRASRVVENAFGIFISRFGLLQKHHYTLKRLKFWL